MITIDVGDKRSDPKAYKLFIDPESNSFPLVGDVVDGMTVWCVDRTTKKGINIEWRVVEQKVPGSDFIAGSISNSTGQEPHFYSASTDPYYFAFDNDKLAARLQKLRQQRAAEIERIITLEYLDAETQEATIKRMMDEQGVQGFIFKSPRGRRLSHDEFMEKAKELLKYYKVKIWPEK